MRLGVSNFSSEDSDDSDISARQAGTRIQSPTDWRQVLAAGPRARPGPAPGTSVCTHDVMYCIRYEVDKTHGFLLGWTPSGPRGPELVDELAQTEGVAAVRGQRALEEGAGLRQPALQ